MGGRSYVAPPSVSLALYNLRFSLCTRVQNKQLTKFIQGITDTSDFPVLDYLSQGLGLSPNLDPPSSTQGPEANKANKVLGQVESAILTALNDSSSSSTGSIKHHPGTAQPQGQEDPEASRTLILDGLDFLLSATACPVQEILDLIGLLHEHPRVDNLVINLCADSALLYRQTTPLEVAHAALVVSVAHRADLVMSTRQLDTGAARDVSGVLRVAGTARGTGGGGGPTITSPSGKDARGVEYLYFVGIDSKVRVFERGT